MKAVRVSHYFEYAVALVFFGVMILVGFWGGDLRAEHTEQFKAKGFAYAAIDVDEDGNTETGLGYLSFGCDGDGSCEETSSDNFPTGYGVRINTNPNSDDEGKFFGYAWSSNYGWVSFYHNDVDSCGSDGGLEIPGDVQQFIHSGDDTAILEGYARVLNYDNSEWDGCIKFSGEAGDGTEYGTKIYAEGQELKLGGWAWGSDLIGWVSFDCEFCEVSFSPVETECEEADGPLECSPEGPESGLALYVGDDQTPNPQIVGNSTHTVSVQDIDDPESVKLIPQTFGQDVSACVASASGNQGASIAGWGGVLSGLDPLSPDDISNSFIATISDYDIGEIITFTITCTGELDGETLSAQAFVTMQFPEGSVSIDASPNPIDTVLDPAGTTTLSWNFTDVQEDTCEINGFVDFTPAVDDDALEPITAAFAEDIGFNSWSPNNPGSDDLFGIINFPLWFQITCLDYADQPLSDDVYITTTEIGCTGSMEAAGYCSDDINPIFEEF